ncbi:Uncharacterised protein [Mycobacteroides abscessus subsp. abscessus]|nr:Uncharacterised protein [Mycobacteroides abscessus subsp. abscessus]
MVTSAASSISAVVDQIVVSVGPYILRTDRAEATRSRATSEGNCSPPTSTSTPASAGPCPAPRKADHNDGVAWMTSGRCREMSAASRAGS